jgi:hypothetical protein
MEDGKIIPVYDLIAGVKSGLACKDWNDGVAILNKQGYITGETEVLDPIDMPMPEDKE